MRRQGADETSIVTEQKGVTLIKIQSDEGLERLRFAIVKQAVNDYLYALKYLRKHPDANPKSSGYLKAKRLKDDCERFFKSKWFGTLYDISGEDVMKAIRRRFYNRNLKWSGRGKATKYYDTE